MASENWPFTLKDQLPSLSARWMPAYILGHSGLFNCGIVMLAPLYIENHVSYVISPG